MIFHWGWNRRFDGDIVVAKCGCRPQSGFDVVDTGLSVPEVDLDIGGMVKALDSRQHERVAVADCDLIVGERFSYSVDIVFNNFR